MSGQRIEGLATLRVNGVEIQVRNSWTPYDCELDACVRDGLLTAEEAGEAKGDTAKAKALLAVAELRRIRAERAGEDSGYFARLGASIHKQTNVLLDAAIVNTLRQVAVRLEQWGVATDDVCVKSWSASIGYRGGREQRMTLQAALGGGNTVVVSIDGPSYTFEERLSPAALAERDLLSRSGWIPK